MLRPSRNALAVGLLFACLFGAAVWLFSPPLVRTVVRVPNRSTAFAGLGKYESPSQRQSVAFFRDPQRFVNECKTVAVIGDGLRDSGVAGLPVLQGKPEPAAWLSKQLKVEFTSPQDVLEISLTGWQTEDLAVLLNAVREAFLRRVKEMDAPYVLSQREFKREQIQVCQQEINFYQALGQVFAHNGDAGEAEVRALTVAFLEQQLTNVRGELNTTEADMSQADASLESVKKQMRTVSEEFDRLKPSLPQEELLKHSAIYRQAQNGYGDRAEKIEGRRRKLKRHKERLDHKAKKLRQWIDDLTLRGATVHGLRNTVGWLEAREKSMKAKAETDDLELQGPSNVAVLEQAVVVPAYAQRQRWVAALAGALLGLCVGVFACSRLGQPRRGCSSDQRLQGQASLPHQRT